MASFPPLSECGPQYHAAFQHQLRTSLLSPVRGGERKIVLSDGARSARAAAAGKVHLVPHGLATSASSVGNPTLALKGRQFVIARCAGAPLIALFDEWEKRTGGPPFAFRANPFHAVGAHPFALLRKGGNRGPRQQQKNQPAVT